MLFHANDNYSVIPAADMEPHLGKENTLRCCRQSAFRALAKMALHKTMLSCGSLTMIRPHCRLLHLGWFSATCWLLFISLRRPVDDLGGSAVEPNRVNRTLCSLPTNWVSGSAARWLSSDHECLWFGVRCGTLSTEVDERDDYSLDILPRSSFPTQGEVSVLYIGEYYYNREHCLFCLFA